MSRYQLGFGLHDSLSLEYKFDLFLGVIFGCGTSLPIDFVDPYLVKFVARRKHIKLHFETRIVVHCHLYMIQVKRIIRDNCSSSIQQHHSTALAFALANWVSRTCYTDTNPLSWRQMCSSDKSALFNSILSFVAGKKPLNMP